MNASAINMYKMVKLDLPDSTPVVYKDEEVNDRTIGIARLKNWRGLWGGNRNALGPLEYVWCPNNDPDSHAIYSGEGYKPEKVFAYPLYFSLFEGSKYRHPNTLGEYKAGAALIMKVESILEEDSGKKHTTEEWEVFQNTILQPAIKAVKDWGEIENLKNLLAVGDLKLTNSVLGELFVLKGLTDMKVFVVFKQVSSDQEITISICKEFGSFHGMLKYLVETNFAYEACSINDWRNASSGKKIVLSNGFRETNLQTFESWFVNR